MTTTWNKTEHFLHPGRLPHALSQQRQSLFLAIYYYLKEREIPGGCISGVWASRRLFENRRGSQWGWRVRPSGRQGANWAAPRPAVVAGFLPAGFRVCSLSTIWMNRHVTGLENRRRKPVLCPNTTENVSIHWVTIPFQSSAAAVVPKSPCSETWMFLVFGYIFAACWFTFTHDYSSRRGLTGLTLGGSFPLLLVPLGVLSVLDPSCIKHCMYSHMVLVAKNLPANAESIKDAGSRPGSGRSPEEEHGNPLQYSCLENPMDRRTWWAAVHRVATSQT